MYDYSYVLGLLRASSSSQDADEREPDGNRRRGSLRFAMSKERVRSGVVSGPSPGRRRTARMRRRTNPLSREGHGVVVGCVSGDDDDCMNRKA